jgi:hypothetical protein
MQRIKDPMITENSRVDEFVKSQKSLISVIPAQAGIQEFQIVTKPLDTRFRGYDDFLREYQG